MADDRNEPISLKKNYGALGASVQPGASDVAKAFEPALAVAANLTSDGTLVKTVSDGVETTWDVAALRALAPVEGTTSGAVGALRKLASKLDASTQLATDADFKEAWAQLEKAAAASNDMLRGVALALAGAEFDQAAKRLAGETTSRRLFALLGAAFARFFTGELALGLAALEEIASSDKLFGDNGWAVVVELGDMLARLSGRLTTAEFLRERAERYKTWTQMSSNASEAVAERAQAFELSLATELLATDLPAARDALRRIAQGSCRNLSQEAAVVYKRVFGEEIAAPKTQTTLNWRAAIATPAPAPPRNVWTSNPVPGTRQALTIKGIDFAFRYCPPGTFQMGSPEDEEKRRDDETRHEVTLTRGFWMLETSVTQGMYRAITGSNPSRFKSGDNYPVEWVSWFDSQSFCESLNALGGAPAGFEFRLPTEAEWEYACRAGTNTPYFWGSKLNGDKANCNGNCPYGGVSKGRYLKKTSAVGSYPANGWGLCDMHGNVWEWCADWYGAYASGPQTDPTGPTSGRWRVLRGSSWYGFAKNCRSAYRHCIDPTDRFSDCGFRLVLGR